MSFQTIDFCNLYAGTNLIKVASYYSQVIFSDKHFSHVFSVRMEFVTAISFFALQKAGICQSFRRTSTCRIFTFTQRMSLFKVNSVLSLHLLGKVGSLMKMMKYSYTMPIALRDNREKCRNANKTLAPFILP